MMFALLTVASILSGCSLRDTVKAPESSDVIEERSIALTGENGKSVFDILKSKYQVDSSDSSFGVMINSINGLASTDKEFWLYSVNGKPAEVAADKYITNNGDQIVWEYKGI